MSASLPPNPPARSAESGAPPGNAFFVPPLPPDSPLPRWQQFCWADSRALNHLDEAGAQGWELVSVTAAVTSPVTMTHGDLKGGRTIESEYIAGSQTWVVCFKRRIPSP